MGHTLKGHSLRVGGALVGAVAAFAMAAGPAQAASDDNGDGCKDNRRLAVVKFASPEEVRAADENGDGLVCMKVRLNDDGTQTIYAPTDNKPVIPIG